MGDILNSSVNGTNSPFTSERGSTDAGGTMNEETRSRASSSFSPQAATRRITAGSFVSQWLSRKQPTSAAGCAASVAAVKRVVDRSLVSFDEALVAETDAFGALTAAGLHLVLMQRYHDAGGQTREGETSDWNALFDAMDD